MSEQDRAFIKNFALLLIGLMVFTVIVILLAVNMNSLASRPPNPEKLVALEARIAPVGKVYSGAAGRRALENALQQQAPAAPAPKPLASAAFGGSLDGETIYNGVCTACHTAGIAGSPQLTQTAWELRLAKGVETLIANATNGFQGDVGLMPAKGGRSDLSDEQMAATVRWMLDNLK